MKKIYIPWDEVFTRLDLIDEPGIVVYGVPKGGMILAGFLLRAKATHMPEKADVFLDDIVASGKTKEWYAKKYPGVEFKALFSKAESGWLVFPWEADHPVVEESVHQNITRMLQYLGEEPGRGGLLKTPDRIVKSWAELYKGYDQDPSDLFLTFDSDGYESMVVLKDIELYSMCEHHMLPFYGKAHVAYIPDKRVVGISKLARLVDIYARRLQIQERICEQVTDALMEHLKPVGAACIIEASHMCMRMRGVSKQNSVMITSSVKGAFMEDQIVRDEFMNLIK